MLVLCQKLHAYLYTWSTECFRGDWHTSSALDNRMTLTFDLWPVDVGVNTCRATATRSLCLPSLVLMALVHNAFPSGKLTHTDTHRCHWSSYTLAWATTGVGNDPLKRRRLSQHNGHDEILVLRNIALIHTVSQKTKQIYFCQNFVKFPPISIIFGRKMGNDPNICEVHLFWLYYKNAIHQLTNVEMGAITLISACYYQFRTKNR